MNIRHVQVDTVLGPVTLVAKDEAVTGLYFNHIRRPGQKIFGPEVAVSADSLLDDAVRQLLDYLAGQREEFDLTLAQQVGQAVGANPLCISLPCHRVVGSNGSLTGYAGGLKRKKAPLQLEGPAQLSAGRLF